VSPHDVAGLVACAGFAVVAVAGLRRALSPQTWEVAILAVVLTGLILAALYAPELDGPRPIDLAGEPGVGP
jgi:hypothetical protein